MPLNEDLERIVERGRAEVKCSQCGGTGVWRQYDSGGGLLPPGVKHICRVCHGTGKVPDPRYKDLVAALMEECSVHYTMVGNRYTPHVSQAECHGCKGSNRVPRTEWKQGELVIPLLQESIKSGVIGLDLAEVLAQRALLALDANEMVAKRVLEEMEATHATE